MNKMTKWALPLSLLMMVGVQSGATEASAKTITSDTAKQTSMSNCNWQYNQSYNLVKLDNNFADTLKVEKLNKTELDKYLASLYAGKVTGSNKGTTSNTGSNKGTTNTGSNQGTTSNTDSNKGTTTTGSNQGTTSNTGSNKGTTNTGSNKGTTSNTDSNQGTTNTGSNQGTTSNTDSNKGTTNTGSNQGTTSNNGSNTTTSTNANSSVSQFEQEVVTLTNAERAKEGLAPLQIDTKLMSSARAKSEDMSKNHYFDHTSPTYGSPFDQMKSLGISYKSAGENIAQGQKTPQEVVQAWMQSPGHRANIMNASYTHIGVGYAASGNYWTQQFIQK
ncbi:CAP domain-containing protein [Rummeliibacillus pycnus]|uniref:CAP domain-containing protein n=1 Tax=Rummeliibacillus pycnus TaxID=101070 RepID=UPI001FE9B9FF|nr:CAP domain-containing protein [Rummeliibacillus pycnus]